MTAEARQSYEREGYVYLPQFFPTAVVQAFLQRLYADLDLSRNSGPYQTQGPLITKPAIEVASHFYPPMATFLWGTTPAISEIAGRSLIPSYSYFRIYQKGDVLKVHADRPSCEHSLSLVLYLAEDQPWALAFGRRTEASLPPADDFAGAEFTSVPMHVGDAVMYKGVEHRHGRLDPNPNSWSAHLFMHWVDPEGPQKDHAFDRPTLEANLRKP